METQNKNQKMYTVYVKYFDGVEIIHDSFVRSAEQINEEIAKIENCGCEIRVEPVEE